MSDILHELQGYRGDQGRGGEGLTTVRVNRAGQGAAKDENI
jgi:hypothetical protein